MSSLVLKLFVFFLMALMSGFSALANDHEAPPAGEHGGGGEGEGGASKKEEKPEWVTIQARVATLETKIRSAEEEIKKLVAEKAHNKDPKRTQEIINQMKTLHNEMKTNAVEYEQQRAVLKYRFPEKDLKGARVYERIEVKSIEDMEGQLSLGSSVKKTLKKVRVQYDAPEQRAKKEQTDIHREQQKKENPNSLTEPVILKK